jgi:hypothetical protein
MNKKRNLKKKIQTDENLLQVLHIEHIESSNPKFRKDRKDLLEEYEELVEKKENSSYFQLAQPEDARNKVPRRKSSILSHLEKKMKPTSILEGVPM